MTTLSLYALNEVIVELEVPFAPHQDEVPLQEFHRRWNEILLSTLRPAFLNSDYTMDAHRAHAHLLLLGASDHLLPRRFSLSNPLEAVLRNAACDVAVFRAASPGA